MTPREPGSTFSPALHFPDGYTREGFTTLGMTAWDGDSEPVARELLQNCMDATREAGRDHADVHFTIERVPLERIPGIAAYREHFETAVREHGSDATGPAATGIQRIRDALAAADTGLLVCRDNGLGLNTERLDGLLGEGSSHKSQEQTGSYGIGHLTAFSASDLRYVLYAGRAHDDDGALREIASGHAILASAGRAGAHGYWIQQPSLFDPNRYPEAIPPVLARHLEMTGDTGSVVCIVGFNSFREDADSALLLRRAAAMHFLAAVHDNAMTVHVRDAVGRDSVVNRSALPVLLDGVREQRRSSTGLAGEFAHRAWRTLEEGELLTLAGAKVRFRLLESGAQRDSRVHVFRNGMWVASDVQQLRTGAFAGYRPFDAVILLDHGELYDLVCGAEGPEHRGLTPKRLGEKEQQDRLNALLRALRDGLRDHAGEEQLSQQFIPRGFASVRGVTLREAERVRRRRFRREPEGGRETPVTGRGAGTVVTGSNGHGTGTRRSRPASAPLAGRAAHVQSTLVPRRGERGEIESLSVRWRFRDDPPPAAVGVRVLWPSGSDETCEAPLRPEWIRMLAIRDMDGTPLREADRTGGVTELLVPPTSGGISIQLAAAVPAHAVLALDVVRRVPSGDE